MHVIAAAAICAAVGVTIFFIWTLHIRTDYKDTALEINLVLKDYQDRALIGQGGEYLPATSQVVNWYDIFLLDENTGVYSRKEEPVNDKTIYLVCGENTLSFTGFEDGSAIQVVWDTPDTHKSFRVRSLTTFRQLEAYYSNFRRKSLSS